MKMKEKQIKKHEEQYYHIPKGRLRYIFSTILLLGLCFLFYKVTLSSWNFLELSSLECSEEFCSYFAHQLLILPLLILNYILISLTILSSISIFKKLKSYDEEGLIMGLIMGLIAGLIAGLIIGLIIGLIMGLIIGLIIGLIMGLIAGLILGLIMGLILEN